MFLGPSGLFLLNINVSNKNRHGSLLPYIVGIDLKKIIKIIKKNNFRSSWRIVDLRRKMIILTKSKRLRKKSSNLKMQIDCVKSKKSRNVYFSRAGLKFTKKFSRIECVTTRAVYIGLSFILALKIILFVKKLKTIYEQTRIFLLLRASWSPCNVPYLCFPMRES